MTRIRTNSGEDQCWKELVSTSHVTKGRQEYLKLNFISGTFSKGKKKENERDSEEFERRT